MPKKINYKEIMKTETRIYKLVGKKQKIRIAKMRNEKVGFFAWIKLYFVCQKN